MMDMETMPSTEELVKPFCTPQWRVQRTNKERIQGKYPEGTRGLVVAYIDARQVFSRLDELCGPGGWQTAYRMLDAASGAVECTLTIAGISKSDVGYPNRSGDEEPLKAAYSDATKRAAVQWGIGRWLYELPARWVALDERGQPRDPPPRDTPPPPPPPPRDPPPPPPSTPAGNGHGAPASSTQLRQIEQLLEQKGQQAHRSQALRYARTRSQARQVIERLEAL